MSPEEEEYQMREDLDALLKGREEVNQRLNFLENFLPNEAQVLLRRDQALRRIEGCRGS